MAETADYDIKVSAQTFYIEDQSAPEQCRYAFAYRIIIRNAGKVPAQLLTRHWIITDSDGRVQEVHGEGVVGEKPHLQPGEAFQYTSGAIIETPVGSMRGSYQMIADDGMRFDAEIPVFTLAVPGTLH